MQGVELVGAGVDGDGDGVADELSVGDVTALTLYQASQPRPVTKLELASLGLMDLTDQERASINRGTRVFSDMQCDTCHKPQMKISNPIFSEPSQMPEYRDAKFPSGADPVSLGIDPAHPITFDLTKDTPENVLTKTSCDTCKVLGNRTLQRAGRLDGVPDQPDPLQAELTVRRAEMRAIMVAATVATMVAAARPASAAPVAYVANSGNGSVSVVDVETNAVLSTMPLGTNPFGVAVDPSGARVYATNRDDGTISVIDPAAETVVATVDVGSSPTGIAVDASGRRLYVANRGSDSVTVLDTSTNAA